MKYKKKDKTSKKEDNGGREYVSNFGIKGKNAKWEKIKERRYGRKDNPEMNDEGKEGKNE